MVASQLSVKPRTGQTPSQATISKLKSAMSDPSRTKYGVSIAERPAKSPEEILQVYKQKQYGYYDPQDSFDEQNKKIQYQLSQPTNSSNFTNLKIQQIEGGIGRNRSDLQNNLDRARVMELMTEEREASAVAHMQGVVARLQNGEIVAPVYFQNNIIQAQLGVISSQQFLTVYQSYVKNGTIHKPIIVEKPVPVEIPTPTPTAPAITSSISLDKSWSNYAILGIGVVIFLIILRRRA